MLRFAYHRKITAHQQLHGISPMALVNRKPASLPHQSTLVDCDAATCSMQHYPQLPDVMFVYSFFHSCFT